MSYLVDTTDLKKKFCVHDFKPIHPQGSNKPINVCIKCRKTKKFEIESEKLIKYMGPAFEQSEIDPDDEWRFGTNYLEMNTDGVSIPGTKEEHYWCDTWHSKGCPNLEGHKDCKHKGKIFLKQYKKYCFRASCRKCYRKWMVRQANRGTRRIEKYAKKSGKEPIHIFFTIPERHYHLPLKTLRKIATTIAKEIGLKGGAIMYHPYNKKQRILGDKPHFHVIAFGTTVRRSISYYKYGWVVINKGFRKSVFGTFYYDLSHCGIKKGFQAVTWFGDLSYSKLKLEKEPNSNICPACGNKLVPIYYKGTNPPAPPDQYFEGFVDPAGFYEVETMQKLEWTSHDRYEYALNQSLYYANKGINIST
jgi:hypothetical protein